MVLAVDKMNLSECVKAVQRRLEQAGLSYGHGTDNAADEAAWLVLHCMGLPVDAGGVDARQPVPVSVVQRIDECLEQRIERGLPLAYVIGEAWFCGLPFTVNRHVLVPRSPIAELIQTGFQPWIAFDGPGDILDLCTGSGCIAIAMAKAFPDASLTASDVSQKALAVAAENCIRHAVENRVRLARSDLFDRLTGTYDLIVSNPPYVAHAERWNLPAEYRHEPTMGFDGGTDGLDLVLRILHAAGDYLKDNGILIMEVGMSEPQLVALLPELPFLWLEFEHGGQGVCLLEKHQLVSSRPQIDRALTGRKHVA